MQPAIRPALGGLALVVLTAAASAAAVDPPRIGPVLGRLLGDRSLRAGEPGQAAVPGPEELRLLARFVALDTESTPPRVHVWMRLDGRGREAVRALGLGLESDHGNLVSAIVPLPRLRALSRVPGLEWMQASRRHRPELDDSIPAIAVDAAFDSYGVTGSGVVIGIVDSGLDLTHEDFRHADGTTRVRFLWDQTDDCGSPPPGFSFGCYYTEAEVDDFLDGFGTVDFSNPDGHGSHVTGIAGGDGSQAGNGQPAFQYVGVAPAADLIAVKIFPDVGSCGPCNAGDALTFIDDRAAALGQPYAANMSFGTDFGGHDGSDPDEIVIDALTGPGHPGKAVVKSAGNNGGLGIHASGTVTTGTSQSHTFLVPAYSPLPGIFNDVIVWQMWYDGGDAMTVTVTGPNGSDVTSSTGGGFQGFATADGVIIIDDLDSPAVNGSRFFDVEIDDQCSEPGCGFFAPAPVPGTWTFRVQGQSITQSGRYDMWIWFSSFGQGRLFADWDVPDFSQLLTVPGTAFHITTVASFVTKAEWTNIDGNTTFFSPEPTLGERDSFSSPGPTRDGRIKPEVAAPGMGIGSALAADAAPAVLADPVDRLLVLLDGEHWVLRGTSFSAPHVTGIYALMLELNPTLDAIQLRTLLTTAATADPFTGPVPNLDWGYGKANAQAALDNLVKPVSDLHATGNTTFLASDIPQADSYAVFRIPLSTLDGTDYGTCIRSGLPSPAFTDITSPSLGDGFGYTVAGDQDGIAGLIGFRSDGTVRPRPNCP